MPLYEYECTACGHRFERIQKYSDPPVQTCPTCNGSVKKLLSSPAIQFKGTGWYVTDYARKDSGAAASSSSSERRSESGEKKSDSGEKKNESGSSSSGSSSGDSPSSTKPSSSN